MFLFRLLVLLFSVLSAPVIGSEQSVIKATVPGAETVPVVVSITGPPVITSPLESLIVTQCNRPGVFALTFDDGPSNYTVELLDLLKKNDVKATFFINGNNTVGDITLEPYPTVIKRMVADGHQVASHSYTHPDFITLTPQAVTDEMTKNDNAIKTILGVRPRYMRIPFGSYNDATLVTLSTLEFRIIWLNVDSMDWDHVGNPNFVGLNQGNYSLGMAGGSPTTNSYVSLQHDIHADTVHLWAQVAIDTIRTAGYQFVTVGDCVGEPDSANWYRA